MKNIYPKIAMLLFLLPALLTAQEAGPHWPLWQRLYIEGQFGLFISDGYDASTIHVGAGYRFDEHHSLGISLIGFGHGEFGNRGRGAGATGARYRFQKNRWLLDLETGYVNRYTYRVDNVTWEYQTLYNKANRWYYRVGVTRLFRNQLTVGVSYAFAGHFHVEWTNELQSPPELQTGKINAPQAFTFNLGILIQRMKD